MMLSGLRIITCFSTSKTSNEWASGKDLNAPAPSGDSNTRNDTDADSIIPQGACGSFVTALEDEFMGMYFVLWEKL